MAFRTHPVLWEKKFKGYKATRIAETYDFNAWDGFNYVGHLGGTDSRWWNLTTYEQAYKYPNLDLVYPDAYHNLAGHLDRSRSDSLVEYMRETFHKLRGRPMESLLELGTGNGHIIACAAAKGMRCVGLEGSHATIEHLKNDSIRFADLRLPQDIGETFDMVMCTEVAEHIEPFCAGVLVSTCVKHSDLVWFSASPPAHTNIDHPNEVPIEAWDNLFALMGHSVFLSLDGREDRASRLYVASDIGEQLIGGAE